MAICQSCGAESARVRTVFEIKGKPLPQPKDECPVCAPHSFEAIKDPSTQKIWMHHEVAPGDYEKRYDTEGVIYVPKPESTAALEAEIARGSTEELERQARAEHKKRLERRTEPMDSVEMQHAMRKAELIAGAVTQSAVLAAKQQEEAEMQAWIEKAGRA